jgi:hypothetical protein
MISLKRCWVGNQIYLLSVLLAHNLGRELQMIAHPPSRATLEKRPAFWASCARYGLNILPVITLRSKSAKIRPPAMRSQDPEGYAVPSARSVG